MTQVKKTTKRAIKIAKKVPLKNSGTIIRKSHLVETPLTLEKDIILNNPRGDNKYDHLFSKMKIGESFYDSTPCQTTLKSKADNWIKRTGNTHMKFTVRLKNKEKSEYRIWRIK